MDFIEIFAKTLIKITTSYQSFISNPQLKQNSCSGDKLLPHLGHIFFSFGSQIAKITQNNILSESKII